MTGRLSSDSASVEGRPDALSGQFYLLSAVVTRTLDSVSDATHDPLISGRPVTETRHDALGKVAWTRDPEGRFVVLEHDDAGQETRRCLAQDEDDDGELDPEEDLVECVTTEHDDIGRRTATENALGHRTTHAFNEAGQLASRCTPSTGRAGARRRALGARLGDMTFRIALARSLRPRRSSPTAARRPA